MDSNLNHQSKLNLKPGYVIEDVTNNNNYGVLVNDLKDDYLVFRLDNDTLPVFSKLKKKEQLRQKSHINHPTNKKLKEELLRYYRTRYINPKQEKVLKNVLNEAFPNGVPLYDERTPSQQIYTSDDI